MKKMLKDSVGFLVYKAGMIPAMRGDICRYRISVQSILLLAALATGCAPLRIPGKGGASHYVIVGIGVVSVTKQTETAATVVRSRSLGAAVTDSPGIQVCLGYASGTSVSIPDNALNVQIEIGHKPGVLKIDSVAAHLKPKPKRKHE